MSKVLKKRIATKPLKRFMVFLGHPYYPNGGMDDFLGDFSTKKAAIQAITDKLKAFKESKSFDFNGQSSYFLSERDAWWHIYDNKSRKIITRDREVAELI